MVEGRQKYGVGVFPTQEDAEQAIQQLKNAGFSMDKVSIVARRAEEDEQVAGKEVSDHIGNQSVRGATGAVADTLTHASWASVLVGLTGLALPGIGPILAAGGVGAALVASVAGVGAGAASTANLGRVLSDFGMSKAQAEVYSDQLILGNYLIILEGTDDQINEAASIFNNHSIQKWGVYEAPKTQVLPN